MGREFAELQNGRREAGPHKSAAGARTIAMLAALVQVMDEHLVEQPASGGVDLARAVGRPGMPGPALTA